jgi:hypothetical protein
MLCKSFVRRSLLALSQYLFWSVYLKLKPCEAIRPFPSKHILCALVRDMGTHGSPPTRVLEVPAKWTWPFRSSVDLQVGPETLSTTPATLEDSRTPYPDPGGSAGLAAQDSFAGRGTTPPVAHKSRDSPCNQGGWPSYFVTDPDEGPPTSNGSPSPLTI